MTINISISNAAKIILLLVGGLGLAACSASFGTEVIRSINSDIVVSPTPGAGRNIRSTNGNIVIDSGMEVENIRNVNGRILLRPDAAANNISTVNGRINIEAGTLVRGDVAAVNGDIIMTNGGQVQGLLKSSNGKINLSGVTVEKNVETTNGDIEIDRTIVKGDMIIHPIHSVFPWTFRKPKVVIGPDTEIRGELVARQDIRLYVHESANIGYIEGADAVLYAGQRP